LLAVGLGCRRGDRGRSTAIDGGVKPTAVADAGAGESVTAAIAAGTHCFSFLDLEIPKAASRQIAGSVQRCAATVPTQQGLEDAHLRIRIESSGRVRDVKPFDPVAEPIGAPLMGCIQTAARAWSIPHGKRQCIEVAPSFNRLPVDVLLPGYHHADDVGADFKTSRWWAVCLDDDAGPAARPVRWTVHRRSDDCFGDDARIVKVQGCRSPLFLVRGLAMPTARPLPLAVLPGSPDGGSDAPWPVNKAHELIAFLAADYAAGRSVLDGRFAGQSWQVEIIARGDRADAFLIANGKRQWLFKVDHEGIDMLFAGDLDGDGRLDLFIQDGDEAPLFYLLLSSAALPGELIHAVAMGFTSSC